MMIKRVTRSLVVLVFLLAPLSGRAQNVVSWFTACPADNPNQNYLQDCWDIFFYFPPAPPATASSFASMSCDNGFADFADSAITAQCSIAVVLESHGDSFLHGAPPWTGVISSSFLRRFSDGSLIGQGWNVIFCTGNRSILFPSGFC